MTGTQSVPMIRLRKPTQPAPLMPLQKRYGYRAEQNESEPKKLAIDRVAAFAAILALIVSAGNLFAYYHLTSIANKTAADRALKIQASQLQMAQVDERPWLKVEISAESDFTPLTNRETAQKRPECRSG